MPKRTVEERAWGFSQEDYAEAFSHACPREVAEASAKELFDGLRADVEANIGGDDHLFALLSLASESAAARIQALRSWSRSEMEARQKDAIAIARADCKGA